MIAIFRFLRCFAMIVHVRSLDTVYLSIRVSIQKTMDPVIRQIRQDLKEMADPEIQTSSKRFFKEDICCYGIRTADVVGLAKKYWKEIKNKNKQEIFSLCKELYKSGYMEESFVVSQWAHSLSGRYEPEDLAVFKRWIDTYITNWASCDGLCNHTMGDFIEQYPGIHGRTGTVDTVEEPLDAPGGSSLPDRPGKTREVLR
jgi:Predicted DNA alkylation repair enzyme